MSLKDILLPYYSGKPAELSIQIERIATAIQSLVDARNQMKAESADDAAKMLQKIERFPTWKLDEMQQLVAPSQRVKLREISEKIGNTINRMREEIEAGRESEGSTSDLETCVDALRILEVRSKAGQQRLMFLVSCVYFVVPTMIVLLRFYVDFGHGLAPVSSELMDPAEGYLKSPDETACEGVHFRLGDEQELLEKFSNYYFKRTNDLPTLGDFRWKGTFYNRSGSQPIFLSKITLKATFVESDVIAWQQLNVKPELLVSANSAKTNFTVKDQGIGPAINVGVAAETDSGFIKIAASKQCIWNTSLEFPLWVETGDKEQETLETRLNNQSRTGFLPELDLVRFVDGDFKPELFLKLEQAPNWTKPPQRTGDELIPEVSFPVGVPFAKDGIFFVTDDKTTWFRKLSSIEDLRSLTDVSCGETLKIRIDYQSLRGEPYSADVAVPLPGDRVYFRRLERIVPDRWLTRVSYRTMEVSRYSGYATAALDTMDRILDPMRNPILASLAEKQPLGVDKLEQEFNLDLGRLEPTESVTQSQHPSVYLNARGVVVLDVNLKGSRYGTYRIDILVNHEPINHFLIDTFDPEKQRFAENQISSWLKNGRPDP